MDWLEKVKLVTLGNDIDDSEESKTNFKKQVLEQLNNFDNQAWDMFITVISINRDEIKADANFWKQIYSKSKELDLSCENFGFRAAMRIAMIQTVCEEVLDFNSTPSNG